MGRAFWAVGAIVLAARVGCGVTFTAPPLTLEQAPATAQASGGEQPVAEEDPGYGVTGNWGGARDGLRKNHIDIGGSVLLDVSKVLRGGLDTEAWPVAYLLDLHVTIDMDGFGLKGGTFFANFQSHDQSENGDAAVGDIQAFDNIYAPRNTQIAQMWYRQRVGDFRIKVGKIDANADASAPGEDGNDCFSLMEHSLDFIQSAAAFSPTIFAMPTYPEGAPGVEVFYHGPATFPGEWYVGAGGFYSNTHQTFLNISGHPEKGFATAGGMFVIGEAGARWEGMGDALCPGHMGLGGWYHCGDFERADGAGRNRSSGGGFFFLDQSVYHTHDDERTRDVGFFFQAAYADRTTSPMDTNLMFGVSASGLIDPRPDDAMGVMVSWVHLTEPGLAHAYEVATEVFYKFQITPWASLKPSFAYIASPGGTQRDAAVLTVRAEVDF